MRIELPEDLNEISTRGGFAAFWTPDVEGVEAVGGELTFGFSGAPRSAADPRRPFWNHPGRSCGSVRVGSPTRREPA
jgi:hypothetical protein